MIIVKYTEDGRRVTFRPEDIQENLGGKVGVGELTLEEGVKQLWFAFDGGSGQDKQWFYEVAVDTFGFGNSQKIYEIVLKL